MTNFIIKLCPLKKTVFHYVNMCTTAVHYSMNKTVPNENSAFPITTVKTACIVLHCNTRSLQNCNLNVDLEIILVSVSKSARIG